MRSLVKNSALTFGILAGLTAILIVLACLQYRWTGGVSEADRERMHRQIVAAGDEFQREFYSELSRACVVFRDERAGGPLTLDGHYADRYESWTLASIHPQLIANVFVWREGNNKLGELVRLDPASRQFVPVDPPPTQFERLRNAVKYGGEKRWMSLRAEVSDDGQKPEVLITVEGRGVGIDPSEFDHIFEPFYRGKAADGGQIHGTGLGLALTKFMIEEMGGHLSVASVPGEGSAFTLHLPVASRAGAAASLASGHEGHNVRPV